MGLQRKKEFIKVVLKTYKSLIVSKLAEARVLTLILIVNCQYEFHCPSILLYIPTSRQQRAFFYTSALFQSTLLILWSNIKRITGSTSNSKENIIHSNRKTTNKTVNEQFSFDISPVD